MRLSLIVPVLALIVLQEAAPYAFAEGKPIPTEKINEGRYGLTHEDKRSIRVKLLVDVLPSVEDLRATATAVWGHKAHQEYTVWLYLPGAFEAGTPAYATATFTPEGLKDFIVHDDVGKIGPKRGSSQGTTKGRPAERGWTYADGSPIATKVEVERKRAAARSKRNSQERGWTYADGSAIPTSKTEPKTAEHPAPGFVEAPNGYQDSSQIRTECKNLEKALKSRVPSDWLYLPTRYSPLRYYRRGY